MIEQWQEDNWFESAIKESFQWYQDTTQKWDVRVLLMFRHNAKSSYRPG